MSIQTVTLDELKDISLEEIIQRVLAERTTLTIRVSEGDEVTLQPKPKLEPLPVLEGYVPVEWKDAIYE